MLGLNQFFCFVLREKAVFWRFSMIKSQHCKRGEGERGIVQCMIKSQHCKRGEGERGRVQCMIKSQHCKRGRGEEYNAA